MIRFLLRGVVGEMVGEEIERRADRVNEVTDAIVNGASPDELCSHVFGKWEDAQTASLLDHEKVKIGIVVHQRRVCKVCGLLRMRAVTTNIRNPGPEDD